MPGRRFTPFPRFAVSRAFVRAVNRSFLSQTALAFPAGMTQSQLSTILHGRSFRLRVVSKVAAIGRRLGLKASQCTRPVRRGSR